MASSLPRQHVPEIDPDIKVGLTQAQAQARMDAGWSNRTPSATASRSQIICRHCFTFFNLVFLVLAAVLVLVRSSLTNFGFLMVVVLNTCTGITQELRARRAVEKLTLLAAGTYQVLRDGQTLQLPDRELVRDDIVYFHPGDQICADGVLRGGHLQVNESLITGEPDPISKGPGDELMSGSFVVAGSAAVQLVRVGPDSYAARLAAQAKKDPKAVKSEMMQDLDKLIRFLSIVLVPLGLLYFIAEVAVPAADTHRAAEQTVAALVSMIPQGLYLLTTIALAASSLKLARHRVLVQDRNCIETLARVDVLCLDKTGTITQPGMQVEDLIPLPGPEPEYLQEVLAALCQASEEENETARALAETYGGSSSWVCRERIPFSSEIKWSGAVFPDRGAFVLGAPETILAGRYDEVASLALPWQAKGFRVLLCAGYEGTLRSGPLDPERVTPLALIVLRSRIRDDAPETLRYFTQQGVSLKVISGDSPVTASQIALRAGVPQAERFVDCQTLTTPEALSEAAAEYTVFGRVTPEQKRALVRALQKKGHTVAMTGDGVNDVLAMRQADCAVAMASGAQAASQVAQLVLLDSDFSAMPRIVGEGRRVVGNIQRAAALFLVKNIFTMALVLVSVLTPLMYPFQPVTLTVITALTVGIPSFFFAMEPNRERIRGRFLSGALRRALPAGLSVFAAIVVSQILADKLSLGDLQLRTVCAAVTGTVGLLVLLQISQPMTKLRKLVIGAMTLGLVGAFVLLGPVFAVDVYHLPTALLMLLMAAFAAVLFWLFHTLLPLLFKKEP